MPGGHRPQLGLSAGHRRTAPEPPNRPDRPAAAAVPRRQHQRDPHLGSKSWELVVGGHDPDDGVRHAIEHDRLAEGAVGPPVGVAAKPVIDDGDGDPGRLIGAGELPAANGWYPVDREESRRHSSAAQPLGPGSVGPIETSGLIRGQLDGLGAVTPVVEVEQRGGSRGPAPRRYCRRHRDQPFRLGHVERPESHQVGGGEHRHVDRDRHRQGPGSGHDQTGADPEGPEREPKIEPEAADGRRDGYPSSPATVGLAIDPVELRANGRDVAELGQGLAVGRVGCEPLSAELIDPLGKVESEFLVDVALDVRSEEAEIPPPHWLARFRHRLLLRYSWGAALRTRPTAALYRAQLEAWSRSSRLPAAVRS